MILIGKALATAVTLRILPIICEGFNVSPDEPAFKLLLKMHDLLEVTLSEAFSEDLLVHYRICTDEYFEARKLHALELGMPSLKAKHHFTAHHCELVEFFGPCMLTWTCRFEAKHSETTRQQAVNKNFSNVAQTIARSDQYRTISLHHEGLFPLTTTCILGI